MRRIFIFGFVLLFFSPVFAYAQTLGERYCPNPEKDFFTGNLHEEDGKPWIEVIVDPDFEVKMRKERNITAPLPLTPIYDLVVRIKPNFNTYCIDGREVEASDLPASLPIKGSIIVGEGKSAIEIISGSFVPNKVKDPERGFVYEWKLKGWPDGIILDEKLEKLIAAIAEGKTVTTALDITKKDGTIVRQTSSASFSTCVPISGNGKHKIVTMRGKNTSADHIARKAKIFQELDFEDTDPFKKYKSAFSFFTDLKMHNDSNWRTAVFDSNGNKKFITGVAKTITSISSCPSDFHDTHIFFSSAIKRAYAIYSVKTAFLNPDNDGTIILHELGHAFAGLKDEYAYGDDPEKYNTINTSVTFLKLFNIVVSKNCSTNPTTDFKYENKFYGDTNNIGCGFKDVGLGANKSSIFRPSQESIMNQSGGNYAFFNVVSCGYIIKAIKGGNAKSYFPECMGLNTIKPGYVVSTSFGEKFVAPFSNFLTAQVGGAFNEAEIVPPSTTDSVSDDEFIIEESFSADGTISGDIYLLDDEEETPSPDLSEPTTLETETPNLSCTSLTKVITVGGIGSDISHPQFKWVQDIASVTAEISINDLTVEQGTARLRAEIETQLASGNPVLVVAHSLGAIIAFNLKAEFRDKPVEFIYIDPPYDSVGPARCVASLCSKVAEAINLAFDNGIARDLNTIEWTKGKSMAPFHDPWDSLEDGTLKTPPIDPRNAKGGQLRVDLNRPGLSSQQISEMNTNLDNLRKKIQSKLDCSITETSVTPKVEKSPSIFSRILSGITNVLKTAVKPVARLFTKSIPEPESEIKHYESASLQKQTPYPIRELTLDTLGKTLLLVAENSGQPEINRDGKLIEKINGADGQEWKIKYEHKGSSRRQCEPPVLNLSFDKKDKKGNPRKLFNGKTTYPGYAELEYQKIRLIPDCDIWNDYTSYGDIGFSGASNVLLREYLITHLFRSFGVPSSDVVGFAKVRFVSTDSKYNNKEFRYLMIQRTDELDDQIPFVKQFNLSPQLYESGSTSGWAGSVTPADGLGWTTQNDLDRLTAVNLVNFITQEKIQLPIDPKEAIILSLLTNFFNLWDMSVLHNEDYGLKISSSPEKEYLIIPHGYDMSFSCNIGNPSIGYLIGLLPKDTQPQYKKLLYTTAREIFTNPASLSKMLSAVDAYPFNDDKEKMREFLKLSFYRYAKYVTSNYFAELTEQPYETTNVLLPFSSEAEYQKHMDTFQQNCSRQYIALNNNMISIIDKPVLEILTDEWKNKRIVARFTARVTAGNEEIKVRKNQSFKLDMFMGEKFIPNTYLYARYDKPSNLEDTIGPYYIIPARASADFELTVDVYPNNFIKNAYFVALTSFQPFSNATPITSISNNKTNTLVFGDKEIPPPHIDSIIPDSASTGTEITINGSGFLAEDNTVVFQKAGYTTINADSFDGKTLRVKVPTGPTNKGSTGKFSGKIKVAISTGEQISNIVDFIVEKSSNTDTNDSNLSLSVTKPTITSILPAGAANKFYAGEITLHATIKNEGGNIEKIFSNAIQYKDVKSDVWENLVTFDIARLEALGQAEISHTWKVAKGEWDFRVVANSFLSKEIKEQGNYSKAIRISVIEQGGVVPPPPPPENGAPKLVPATPVISGTEAGAGKIRAGPMNIFEKVTNEGNGVAPPFQILLLYSQDGENWSDWISLNALRLDPQAEQTLWYSWKGNPGKWHFKACEDIKDTCSEPVFIEIVPS